MPKQTVNITESASACNKDLVSGCGLYCGACGIYLATQENDAEKLVQYAVVLNQTFDETLCDGCGAEKKSKHCSKMCTFIDCKKAKGVDFCISCNEFPCIGLIEFKSNMPHRLEILESQIRMKEIGIVNWLSEMKDYFSCPQCSTANTAYQLLCRKCGNTPCCKFVLKHREFIESYLSE